MCYFKKKERKTTKSGWLTLFALFLHVPTRKQVVQLRNMFESKARPEGLGVIGVPALSLKPQQGQINVLDSIEAQSVLNDCLQSILVA